MAYMNGRSCWSNRGRSLDLDYPRSGEVQKIRNLIGSVSPSGDIDRKTNTKYRIGGTMLMFTVGENETVNIWMESCSCLGGYSVNIWIKSVYLLADRRYNKAVKELLSKYAFDAYKSFAEIEARPISARFVYVGYAENDLPKDSWVRIWFGEAEKAENGEKTEDSKRVNWMLGKFIVIGVNWVAYKLESGDIARDADGNELIYKDSALNAYNKAHRDNASRALIRRMTEEMRKACLAAYPEYK